MNAVTQPRHRPFGVFVVALLQLGTVVVALVGYSSSTTLPWESTFTQLLADNGWARVAIVVLGILVTVATVGMWYLRRWAGVIGVAIAAVVVAANMSMKICSSSGRGEGGHEDHSP